MMIKPYSKYKAIKTGFHACNMIRNADTNTVASERNLVALHDAPQPKVSPYKTIPVFENPHQLRYNDASSPKNACYAYGLNINTKPNTMHYTIHNTMHNTMHKKKIS